MSTSGQARNTSADSDRISSTKRGSLRVSAASSFARAPATTVRRSTSRPSALDTIFCAITSTSCSLSAARGRAAAKSFCVHGPPSGHNE